MITELVSLHLIETNFLDDYAVNQGENFKTFQI